MELPCKQAAQIPPVVSEWQTVKCPNCGHYTKGQCQNPNRTTAEAPCPFDGRELPLRDVTEEDMRIDAAEVKPQE